MPNRGRFDRTLSLTLTSAQLARLDTMAREVGKSRSATIRELLSFAAPGAECYAEELRNTSMRDTLERIRHLEAGVARLERQAREDAIARDSQEFRQSQPIANQEV